MWRAGSLLVLFAAGAQTLVLQEMTVPPTVLVSENVTLVCKFDLEGEPLYSVKWYKDGNEFFRYMPDNYPPCRSFPVQGVTLLSGTGCHMETVTLTRLRPNSSGAYRCEVSTEAPSFQTSYETSNMTVLALPPDGPTVEGAQSSYSIGDEANLVCTARSYPPAQVAWFINGLQAAQYLVLMTMTTGPADKYGLSYSSLDLRFVVDRNFFTTEGHMELRCVVTVLDRSQSTVVFSTLRRASNLGLAQERAFITVSAAHHVLPSVGTILISLLYVSRSVR